MPENTKSYPDLKVADFRFTSNEDDEDRPLVGFDIGTDGKLEFQTTIEVNDSIVELILGAAAETAELTLHKSRPKEPEIKVAHREKLGDRPGGKVTLFDRTLNLRLYETGMVYVGFSDVISANEAMSVYATNERRGYGLDSAKIASYAITSQKLNRTNLLCSPVV